MSDKSLIEAIEEALILFAEMLANPKPITAQLLRAWVLVMQQANVTAEQMRRGAQRVLETEEFFPSPAVVLKAIRPPEDTEAKEELAWQKVRGLVAKHGGSASLSIEDFDGDGAALWALERMGYAELCSDLAEDNRLLKRAEYVRLYRLAVQNGNTLRYLEGQFERRNRGFKVTPRMCGRGDWHAFPPSRAEHLGLLEATNGLVKAIAAMPIPGR